MSYCVHFAALRVLSHVGGHIVKYDDLISTPTCSRTLTPQGKTEFISLCGGGYGYTVRSSQSAQSTARRVLRWRPLYIILNLGEMKMR